MGNLVCKPSFYHHYLGKTDRNEKELLSCFVLDALSDVHMMLLSVGQKSFVKA